MDSLEPFVVKFPDGSQYELVRQTTGADHLKVRDASIITDDKGQLRASSDRYEHANLLIRIRREGAVLSDIEVQALPRIKYQTLSTLAIKLDNDEAGEINDFLSECLRQFPDFQSLLETSSNLPVDGSEPLSDPVSKTKATK